MHTVRNLCRRHQIIGFTLQKYFLSTSQVVAGTTPAQLKDQQLAAAKKGALISKYINLAFGAINAGGGSTDPSSNKRLAEVLAQASKEGVPKTKLLNAISNKTDKPIHTLFMTTADGFAVVIECHAKSLSHARAILSGCLKKSLFKGTVTDQKTIDDYFNKKGVIIISKPLKDGKELNEDERTELALDIDAEDVIQVDQDLKFLCSPSSLKTAVQTLEDMNFNVTYSNVDLVAVNPGYLSDDDSQFYEYFLKLIEDVSATPQKACEFRVIVSNLD